MPQEVGQRNNWKFAYKALEVAEAAKRLVDYHNSRIEFWTEEREKTLKELEGQTVSIKRYQQTGGERVEAVIDQRAATRIAECDYKIYNHKTSAADFQRWAVALAAQGDTGYFLDVDDVHYFKLGTDLPTDNDA